MTHTTGTTWKNSTGAENSWGCYGRASTRSQTRRSAPLRSWSVGLTGSRPRFRSSSSLGGTTHQGQWSVRHCPLSSKSNREESNTHTDLCHLSPTAKVNLAFPPQSWRKKQLEENDPRWIILDFGSLLVQKISCMLKNHLWSTDRLAGSHYAVTEYPH